MQEGLFPYLVIEKRNNDFAFIEVSDLDIFKGMHYNSFISLDNLLKEYTEEEIKASITRANVVPDVDILDKRLLIKYGNYKLPVLTKDIAVGFDFFGFIEQNFNNKKINNIFYNKIAAIVKDEARASMFKELLNTSAMDFYIGLNWLTYVELREFFFYVYNDVANKDKTLDNRLKREKE